MEPKNDRKMHPIADEIYTKLLNDYDDETTISILIDLICLIREHINVNKSKFDKLHELISNL